MGGSKKIFIVEDEDGIALHLHFILTRLGYEPFDPVATGEKAVDLVAHLQPDLVLMDIYLAGNLNGIETARLIRDRFDLPVIFLTALSSDHIVQEATQSEPYGYLVKPVHEGELHAAIELALYKHEMEKRLRESEGRYRLLFEKMTGGFVLHEIIRDVDGCPVDYRFLAVNPAFEKGMGITADQVVGRSLLELVTGRDPVVIEAYRNVALSGEPAHFEYYSKEFDRYYDIHIYVSQPEQLASIINDITERVTTEKVIEENEIRFRQLAEGVREVFWLCTRDMDELLYVSPAYERVWGRPCQELYQNGQILMDSVHPEDLARVLQAQKRLLDLGTPFNEEYRIQRLDGATRWIWARTYPVYSKEGEIIRYSGIAEDVTERKNSEQKLRQSYQQVELHLLRQMMLHNIDVAIMTYTDRCTMLSGVMEQVIRMAEVSTALLYLPEQDGQSSQARLYLAEAVGLETKKLKPPAQSWLERQSEEVFQKNGLVYLEHLESQPHLGAIQLALEFGFSNCGIFPLSVKNQVKGVLCLMIRSSACLDGNLKNTFEALTLQIAIAIEHAEMFEGLKRTNAELSNAYEETIRGWAQALELRDKETHGHSERVRDLSAKLARALGMGDDQMLHFLRGVLLHDIGKMAIPDQILLKPGPLTEEEWLMMRKHPRYAYEMLSQIDYLKPSLNVPFYHHERWDGTGYPNGLKGENIPWEARIFSVVDAWDALTWGRPYHKIIWSKQDAITYVREQGGKQFDPTVVKAFLQLVQEES